MSSSTFKGSFVTGKSFSQEAFENEMAVVLEEAHKVTTMGENIINDIIAEHIYTHYDKTALSHKQLSQLFTIQSSYSEKRTTILHKDKVIAIVDRKIDLKTLKVSYEVQKFN